MKWNDLRENWQVRDSEIIRQAYRPGPTERLWSSVRWRDVLETTVAVVMAAIFALTAIWLSNADQWPAAAFALFLVASIMWIIIRLRRARQCIPDPDPAQPVLEFLIAERRAMAAQARLLSSTFVWYWGPIAVGVIGFFVSLHGFDVISLGYIAVVVSMGVGIEIMNRSVVRKQITPALHWVEDQISQLKEDQ